ncbi:MAG: S1C family serine protease [Planctomycetota bacterium]
MFPVRWFAGSISLLLLLLQNPAAEVRKSGSASRPVALSLIEQIEIEHRASAEKLRSALVSVTVELRTKPPADLTVSGTILDNKGRVAIPPGGLDQAAKIRAITSDGREFVAERILNYPLAPLAIIELQGEKLPPAPVFASRDSLKVGDAITVLAHSIGTQATTAFGFISSVRQRVRFLADLEVVQTSVDAFRGIPGGVIGNRKGEIVAIVLGGTELDTGELAQISVLTSKFSSAQRPTEKPDLISPVSGKAIDDAPGPGVNTKIQNEVTQVKVTAIREPGVSLAVPVESILDFLAQAQIPERNLRDTDPPRIGILLSPAIHSLARRHLKIPDNQGMVVEAVYEGTPASTAGIQKQDIIIRAGGEAVGSFEVFARKAAEAFNSGTLTLDLYREGKLITINVVTNRTK